MAMSLRKYSALSSSHIPTGLKNDQDNDGFELKSGLVNMVQASPFCGKTSEDANTHLQNFLEVSSTINPRGTTMDNVRLRLFPFSLLGKAKTWFYTNKADFTTWKVLALLKYPFYYTIRRDFGKFFGMIHVLTRHLAPELDRFRFCPGFWSMLYFGRKLDIFGDVSTRPMIMQ